MIITAQLRNSGSVSPAPVAHSEEQRTFNPRVLGSKPSGGTISLPARMRSKIAIELPPVADVNGMCWAWTGALSNGRYGSVGYNGRTWSTHKLAYTLLVGPVPNGLELDHLCLNKRCCNPSHLEPVTSQVNGRRARAGRTRCAKGHLLAGRNLVIKMRGTHEFRTCRVCQLDWQRDGRARNGVPSRSVGAHRAAILADADAALTKVGA